MNLGLLTTPQKVSGGAMLVVALGAVLPWVSVLGISKVGIEGDGIITLIAAIAGLVVLTVSTGVVGAPRKPRRFSHVALLALAALVTLVAVVDMNGFAAIGLYLTLFGGIAWLVGAVWQLTLSKQSNPVN